MENCWRGVLAGVRRDCRTAAVGAADVEGFAGRTAADEAAPTSHWLRRALSPEGTGQRAAHSSAFAP